MNKNNFFLVCVVVLVSMSTNLFAVASAPDSDKSEFDEARDLELQDQQAGKTSSAVNLKKFFTKSLNRNNDSDFNEDDITEDNEQFSSNDDFDNDVFEQPIATETVIKTQPVTQVQYAQQRVMEEPVQTIPVTEDMLEILDEYDSLIKRKQFSKANETLSNIPLAALNKKQRHQKKMLDIFEAINADKAENERQFGKDESLDDSVMRTIKRLQRQSKLYILEGKKTLPKDLLVQSLYLDRKNFESKQLLDRCLDLPLGSYQVENIEKKYWNDSLIQLRSGMPSKSVDSLQMLANFDPENPMIFERMGSAFYMSGQIKKAVDAWKRALYLSPSRTDLKTFIANAEKEVTRQEALAKAYFDNKTKASEKNTVSSDTPMQVLRVVNDSNTAFSYAQEVRQQLGKNVNVVVEELDNGKWAVKVPVKKNKE